MEIPVNKKNENKGELLVKRVDSLLQKRNEADNLNFKAFMDRVDFLLAHYKISQIKMCKEIGITSPAISGLRRTNGMPSAAIAYKIANFFHVSLSWLISGVVDYDDNEIKGKELRMISAKEIIKDLDVIKEKVLNALNADGETEGDI